ncbi:hypothetical protein LCGC14_0362530 [marine sediment metagenome]|uniref:DUF551 domain-containing protein n=1 Tax=marine sediment metagenome TaxID=412755 RepID=A0A0F9T7W6_9ZZZZ
MSEELKQAFGLWFNKEYPLPSGMERGPIARDLRKGCEKAFMAGTEACPSPWISVTPETMPEVNGKYLVFNQCTLDFAVGKYNGNNYWVNPVTGVWLFEVTHWQPIELPKATE